MRNIITLVFLLIISLSALADNYTYLKGSQLIQSNQAIASNGGTTQLDATSPMKTAITGSNTHIVKLPNASLLLIGTSFQILNKSTQTITVKDFSDVELDTLAPNTDKTYILFSGGLWQSSSGGSGGKIIAGTSPIVITQDATTATISFDYTSAIHNNLSGLNGDPDYYHLSQAKYNAVQNLTASGTQTNFTGDVQSSSCVYYGSSTTNGSYRDCVTGGVFKKEKRVSGSWTEIYRVE